MEAPEQTRKLGPLSLRLLATALALLMLIPVIYLVIRVWGIRDNVTEILLKPRTLTVFLNTVGLAAAVTFSGVVVGTALAWLTVRTDLPCRKWWATLTALPLVVPSYVGAYALIGALGPRGALQHLLQPLGVDQLPSIYGFWGAWLALTLFSYPYVMLSVWAGLRGTDPSIEDAARSLGSRKRDVLLRITLPQLRPAIAAGALLVGLYALSDFGAVSMLQFNSFTRAIYVQYTASFDRSAAAVLALLLVLLTCIVLWLENRSQGRARYHSAGTGAHRKPTPIELGWLRYPALLFCGVVTLVALVIPVSVMLYWMRQGLRAGEPVFGDVMTIWNSVSASGLAAFFSVVVALPIVVLAVRYVSRPSMLIERATYVGYALPGIVVALSLVFFGIRVAPALYQTLTMLVFAYIVLFLPQAVGCIRASLLQISPHLEDAAKNLGRTPGQVVRSITLPLLRPGILTGFALVFLTCMKELPATLLLGPTGFHTLATRIWGHTEDAFFARASGPALLLVLVSAVSIWIILSQEDRRLYG